MSHFPSPSALTHEELIRYAQLALDKSIALPLSWQEELLKRMTHLVDFTGSHNSRRPSHTP